ncbi:MAG TPA: DNA-binding domain-containing protein [Allosphingosinicella sp.]|nr:DNA-binding domain-containing protein [Allosphingosinicella sp.]
MTGLHSIQRWMHDALLFPGKVDGGTRESLLQASPNLPAEAGLAIYQRGYFLRIASCMREQFPALRHALGEPLFDDFVADYIRDRPPESHSLYDLGRRFADWIGERRPDRELPAARRKPWIDFMIDLARFERQAFVLFDAPGHEGKAFAGADTADDRLRLQPCFDLGAFDFPVAAYYHSVRREEPSPLPPAGRSFAALVRTDYVTRTVPLGEAQYLFLEAMAAGGGVEAGAEAAARRLGATAGSVLRSWHSSGDRQRWLDWGFFIAD